MKRKSFTLKRYLKYLLLLILVFIPILSSSQIPSANLSLGVGQASSPSQVALSLQVLILLTVLSLAPAIVIMTTSFIRLVIVFSFVRTAMGTQNMPPNQVLMGLALFLTLFIMMPTFNKVYKTAWQPYSKAKTAKVTDLYDEGVKPLREFMLKQLSGPNNSRGMETLLKFYRLWDNKTQPKNSDDIPTHVLVPAFMTHEITKAFEMGIKIFIPFLMIDLIVASILMAMGMIMLPPVMVALPFKLILFVLVDGWNIIITEMVQSFVK